MKKEKKYKHLDLVPTLPLLPIPIKPTNKPQTVLECVKNSDKRQGIDYIFSSLDFILDSTNNTSSEDNNKKEEKVTQEEKKKAFFDKFNKLFEESLIKEKEEKIKREEKLLKKAEKRAEKQAKLQRQSQAILSKNHSIQSKYKKYNWKDKNLETMSLFYEAEDLYNHMMLACKAENNRMVKMNYITEVKSELNTHIKEMMMDSFWRWLIKRCNNNYFLATIIYQYIEVSKGNKLYDSIDTWYINEMIYGNHS